MVTFTINIPPMLAYIPYMDPMGYGTDDVPNSPALASRCPVSLGLHLDELQ
jgi:hypothetical protein